jgi:hypothetical protein
MDDDAEAFEPSEVPDMSLHCFRGHAGPARCRRVRARLCPFSRHSAPLQVFAVAAGCNPPQYVTGGGDDKAFLWSVRVLSVA